MNVRNHVQLVGHLGGDPELKEINSGLKLASVNLAVSNYYKDKQGEQISETQWHPIKGWGKLAERMGSDLKKGNKVAVFGKLDRNTYEGKDGIKRSSTSIIVSDFHLISKPQS